MLVLASFRSWVSVRSVGGTKTESLKESLFKGHKNYGAEYTDLIPTNSTQVGGHAYPR